MYYLTVPDPCDSGHLVITRIQRDLVFFFSYKLHAEVPNLPPPSHIQPRMAVNAAQHKIVNLLKNLFFAHQFSLGSVCLMCG